MRSNPGTPTLNTMERPLSTDTKSAIGGTRMSEAATPAVAAGNRVSTTRIVGGAGVALAASVAVQNAVFVGTGAPAFGLVWQLHAAAFALALPALGATFIGAALATQASGLTRPWQRLLGVAGGSLLILAGAGNLAIADGSPLLFVGVAGFAAWLVWLVVTGLRLIRGQG